jgi:hypothetical protein
MWVQMGAMVTLEEPLLEEHQGGSAVLPEAAVAGGPGSGKDFALVIQLPGH